MDKTMFRYGSYSTFPQDVEVFPSHLADAGFYYEGNGDEVVCFSCGVKYKGWKKGDNPMNVHRMLSPHCRFLNQGELNTGSNQVKPVEPENRNKTKSNDKHNNTSVSHDSELGACGGGPSDISNGQNGQGYRTPYVTQTTVGEAVLSTNNHEQKARGHVAQTTVGEAVLSTNNHEQKPCIQEVQETHERTNNKQPQSEETRSGNASNMDPLGISFERPVYPHYAITTIRLTSFRHWPKQMTQKPQDLAKAGFFHEGVADKVRCFFCGGGLVNWDPEDEPWTEHARWYPRCVYLRQSKGDDFIYRVQAGLSEPEEKPKKAEIDPLSHPASMSVIDMGYKPDVVRKAWDVLSKENGQENITAEKLLLKVWKLEEDFKGNHSGKIEKITPDDTSHSETETAKEIVSENSLKDTSSQLNRDDRLAIAEENRQLKEQQTCKICLDEDVAIVFLPCGHMAACASCAPALRKCPICQTFIKGTVRAILS